MFKLIRWLLVGLAVQVISACGSGVASGGPEASILGMTLSADGNTLYLANTNKHIVQSLNLTTLSVSTYAGSSGAAGATNGTGTNARFSAPYALVNVGGSLFVADTYNHSIRQIDATQAVTTFVGALKSAGSTDGTGNAALFYFPKGITRSGTDLYIADTSNYLIRKVTSAGVVTTVAGSSGLTGYVDGTSGAKFGAPFAVAANATYVFVSDSSNNAIRSVKISDGTVATVAGSTLGDSGATDATGTSARFTTPAGIVGDGASTLYVADSGNHTIRKIDLGTTPATVTTIAGTAGIAGSADGAGTVSAKFNTPFGLALDAANGILYVSDQNFTKVRKIVLATGVVSTLNVTF